MKKKKIASIEYAGTRKQILSFDGRSFDDVQQVKFYLQSKIAHVRYWCANVEMSEMMPNVSKEDLDQIRRAVAKIDTYYLKAIELINTWEREVNTLPKYCYDLMEEWKKWNKTLSDKVNALFNKLHIN